MRPNARLFQQATTLSARSTLTGPPTRRIGLNVRAFASKTTVKMADRVHRITMFKMPKKADQDTMIEQYKVLGDNQQKDGKPYILSMVVGPSEEDTRSQGYTLVSKTEFASLDDMAYYDHECKAHAELKSFIPKVACDGILTVYFKPTAIGGTDISTKASL